MRKIGIIILNYLAYEDTIECIQTLQEQSYDDWRLIVVDNCSPNDSFERINNKFQSDKRISVVKTGSNIGFAQGNNYGIKILKRENIYRVLVVNGDTLFTDENYILRLATLDVPSSCGMVGTGILDKNGINQNVELAIHQKRLKSWLYQKSRRKRFGLFFKICFQFAFEIQKHQQLIKKLKNEDDVYEVNLNHAMLHGAAVMFCEGYLKKYCGFYPETFLYLEEDFLNQICKKIGYMQFYFPNLFIRHKEDSSTNMLFQNNKKGELNFKNGLMEQNQILLESVKMMKKEDLDKIIMDR